MIPRSVYRGYGSEQKKSHASAMCILGHSKQNYTVSQKKLGHYFTAYNFRNIEQIFTKLGLNHVPFILNIMP